jgi:hypothetical protein
MREPAKTIKVIGLAFGIIVAAVAVIIILRLHLVAPNDATTSKNAGWQLTFMGLLAVLLWQMFVLVRMTAPVTTSAVVRERIERIQNTVAKVRVAIESEATAVDTAMNELKVALEQHEHELDSVTAEVARQKEEAERYKALASLTKVQQDAFLKTLSKNQRSGYVVGFWLGVAGSALVTAISFAVTHWFAR